MAGAITGSAAVNYIKLQAKKQNKGYSSNVPRYRYDPIGYTGKTTVDNKKKNNGSSSSGSSLSAGESAGNSAVLAYLQEIERRQRQAADDAYNRNVAALNDAYAQRGTLLKSNLDSTLQNLQTDYNASMEYFV